MRVLTDADGIIRVPLPSPDVVERTEAKYGRHSRASSYIQRDCDCDSGETSIISRAACTVIVFVWNRSCSTQQCRESYTAVAHYVNLRSNTPVGEGRPAEGSKSSSSSFEFEFELARTFCH